MPPDGEVRPAYAGDGITGFAATVCGHFAQLRASAPPEGLLPPLNPDHHVALDRDVRVVVCLMLDAFGDLQLRAQLAAGNLPNLQRLLERGAQLARLTSVFPPSTAPANVSFSTGLAPAHHGVAGFTIWLPRRAVVANMISGGPADRRQPFETPEGIAAGQTLYERLAGIGVEGYVVNLAAYARSVLSGILYRGATYVPYITPSTVGVRLGALVRDLLTRGAVGFIHAYWPHLDTVAHQTGTASPEYAAEARMVDHLFFGWLSEQAWDGRVVAFVLADHGQVDFDRARARLLNDVPEVMALLARPPAGEHRAVYLKALPGRADELRDRVLDALGADVTVLAVPAAVQEGLFGPRERTPPVHPELEERVGDWIVLARPGVQVNYAHAEEQRGRIYGGGHSGLTAEEMLIPLVSVRL